MKLMMGKGVSRNAAREITKTLREMKETEDLQKHCVGNGEFGRAIRLCAECNCMRRRLYRLLRVASWMAKKYRTKETE